MKGIKFKTIGRKLMDDVSKAKDKKELLTALKDACCKTASREKVEKELESYGLLRCNSCYLVNPKFIRSVRGLELSIGDETLRISRPKRQQFITRLTEWFSGGGVG